MLDIHNSLVKARSIMAERGLAKGVLKDDSGRVCLRGALFEALEGSWWSAESLAQSRACEAAMGFDLDDGPSWNNEPERTLEEVLARFDAAIEATKPAEPAARPTPPCMSQSRARRPKRDRSLVC